MNLYAKATAELSPSKGNPQHLRLFSGTVFVCWYLYASIHFTTRTVMACKAPKLYSLHQIPALGVLQANQH